MSLNNLLRNCYLSQLKKTYIIDYLNIWSDYREMKYNLKNKDFHLVKHKMKLIDTVDFFEFFFTKYIEKININKNSSFIFILKKISNYDIILITILKKYKQLNINFIIIESKFNNVLLDKNKDDFLCQYILMENKFNLISNDKYKDFFSYNKKYTNLLVTIMNFKNDSIQSKIINLNILNDIIIEKKYNRISIPKNNILELF